MADDDNPGLKEIFNEARIRHIGEELAAVHPGCDAAAFCDACLDGLDQLSLMQRLRRTAEALHRVLPGDFRKAVPVLLKLAPRLNSGFVTMTLGEYVALYGGEHFDQSMQALKFLTAFGSSEFAVRAFLRRDLARTLAVLECWSRDQDEHVRRLASEASRPRLPWSLRIPALIDDPSATARILENLKADPSPYVRKSVANHLNDISKDHRERVLQLLERWPLDEPRTAWIARHALRTLIKRGDTRALAVIGAGAAPEVRLRALRVEPKAVRLGEKITLSFSLESTCSRSQRLVVDYAIHYVKKSGATSAKVFKLKTFELPPSVSMPLRAVRAIRDFSTRTHYAGRHEIEVLVNGRCLGRTGFTLRVERRHGGAA